MSLRSKLRIRTRLRSVVRAVWPPPPRPLILAYHRIADEPVDPWNLAVSPSHFVEHLRVLRQTRHPLPLHEFIERHIAGTLPPHAVALTFDDGYVDNLTAAKPRLAAADVPATVFLATGYVDRSEPFWWDELANLILVGKCQGQFALVIRGKLIEFDLSVESRPRGDLRAPSRQRRSVLASLWQSLRHLDEEERRSAMAKLRSIFSKSECRTSLGRAMTGGEVQALAHDGLVTIGAHSVSHPVLSELKDTIRRREVKESKLACENLIGARVTAFAYPFGDFDAHVQEAVKAAGFVAACSFHPSSGQAVGAAADLLALPRVNVTDMDGNKLEQMLRSKVI